MKEVEIQSGIPYHEMKEYFKKVATPVSSGKYLGEQWQVELRSFETQEYKNLRIPQTLLIFKGDNEAVEGAVQHYRRAFLRGGG